MTYSTPETVVSGILYRVIEANERAPGSLDEFVGPATFVVQGKTGQHTVIGEGAARGDAVRFHQKDVRAVGKDVRVWRIYRDPDTGLVAEPLAETV